MTGTPAVSRLRAEAAGRLAAAEYERFGRLLHDLRDEDWGRPTDCPAWDVRRLVAHVVGATEANASPFEMVRQLRYARVGTAFAVDLVTEYQVRHRDGLSPDRLVRRFEAAVHDAVRWRIRFVRYAGRIPFNVGAPVHETWPLGYLAGGIHTRDVWMHRVDVCRASGREPDLSPEHDGRVVADVAADWMHRHGRPVTLTLTGPAGGRYRQGDGGTEFSFDAVEFCRALSGRGGPAPLGTPVPF